MKRGLLFASIFLVLFGLSFISADFPTYLQDKTVSCWNLDETSGSNVIDYGLGQQNNGTNKGGIQNVTSGFPTLGKAYYFSYPYNVTIPSSATLNITGNFTLGASFNSTGSPDTATTSYIAGKGGITAPRSYWMAGASTVAPAAMRASINNGTNNYDVDSSQNVSHQSIFAVMTYNGTYLTLYVNGSVQAVTAVTGSPQQNVYDFTIGHILGGDATDNEYISEVWILNDSINSTVVSDIYNNTNVIPCSSIVPVTPLQNASYQNVYVNNNLTVVNSSSADRGFFNYLGSSISRIVKGWFTDIDVSGTTNLTGQTYIKNASCSTGQVLTTDSSSGLVSCVNQTSSKPALVAMWEQSSTKTNIGTSYVNIYTQTNANGKAVPINTTGYSLVRLHVQWNKIGTGTQTINLTDGAGCDLLTLNVTSGSNDAGWNSIPACASTEKNYKLMAKSTTAGDDPVFEEADVRLI